MEVPGDALGGGRATVPRASAVSVVNPHNLGNTTKSARRSSATGRKPRGRRTRLNLLLEKVAEFRAPRQVARVVVGRVQVLVPRRLAKRDVASEGRGGNLDPPRGGLAGEGTLHLHGVSGQKIMKSPKRRLFLCADAAFSFRRRRRRLAPAASRHESANQLDHVRGHRDDVAGVSPRARHRDAPDRPGGTRQARHRSPARPRRASVRVGVAGARARASGADALRRPGGRDSARLRAARVDGSASVPDGRGRARGRRL